MHSQIIPGSKQHNAAVCASLQRSCTQEAEGSNRSAQHRNTHHHSVLPSHTTFQLSHCKENSWVLTV